jgi:anti-sigma B factor antagonist
VPAGLDAGLTEGPGRLGVATRQQGATSIIELTGEWDIAGAPVAGRAIADALDGRPECVVLDLSRLKFIDSSGLHVTDQLAQRADGEGVRLVIIVDSAAVRRPFEMCGLSERLAVIHPEPRSTTATLTYEAYDDHAPSSSRSPQT